MATNERSVILKLELDVNSLKKSANEAAATLTSLRVEQERVRKENGTSSVEYAKLREQIRQATKTLNDNAAALVINEKFTKGNTGSQNELRLMQKALTTQYNQLTQAERDNSEEGKALTKTLADLSEAIAQNMEDAGDFRGRIGNYERAIRNAQQAVNELEGAQKTIGFAIQKNTEELNKNKDALDSYTQAGDTTSEGYIQAAKNVEFYSSALEQNTKDQEAVSTELQEQQAVLTETTKKAEAIGFVYGQNANAAESLRAQIKRLKEETATYDPGSEKFIEATNRAAELQDKLNDVNDAISAQATGSVFERIGNSAKQAGEDILNADFEGGAEKLNQLTDVIQNADFSKVVGGVKSLGTAFLNLGRVIASSPMFIWLTAITLVVAAAYALDKALETAAEETEEFNKQAEESVRLLERQNEKLLATAEFRVKLAEASGKSEEEQLKARLQRIDAEEAAYRRELDLLKAQQKRRGELIVTSVKERNQEQLDANLAELKRLNDQHDKLMDQESKFNRDRQLERTAYYTQLRKEAEEAAEDRRKEQEAEAEKELQRRKDLNKRLQDEARDAARKIREITLGNADLSIANQRAAYEKEVEFRRSLIEQEIMDETDRAAALLELEQERIATENELAQKELDAKIARIKSDSERELSEIKGTQAQREEQRRLLQEQANEQIEAAQIEFDTEALNRQNELNSAKKELEDALTKDVTEANQERLLVLETALQNTETALRAAGKKEEDIAKATRAQRIEIARQQNKIIQDDAEKSNAEKLKAESDLQAALTEIQLEGAEKQKDISEKLAEFVNNEIAGRSIDAAQQLADSLLNIKQNQLDQELQAVQAGAEAQQAILQKQLDSGIISQEKFASDQKKIQEKQAADEAKLKKEQFKKQKAADLTQAGIRVSLAVLSGYATQPFLPVGLVAGSLAAGLGAVQLAQIASAKEPAFAEGGKVLSGKRIGTTDGKSIRRSNGDNLLASVKVGEVILNSRQQAALGGASTFAAIGVPGFAGGGVVANQITNPIDMQLNNTQIVDAISKLNIVVPVEDIASSLERKATVEQSANVFRKP